MKKSADVLFFDELIKIMNEQQEVLRLLIERLHALEAEVQKLTLKWKSLYLKLKYLNG